jgi:hypothetical protein
VRLTTAVGSVRGLVRELGSPPDTGECNPDDGATGDCPGRLAGVTVMLSSSSLTRRTVTADVPTGAYRFDNVPPGAYTLTFSRAGSTPQTMFVELAAGEDRQMPDVYLEPQARITGQVTSNGLPVPLVEIRIYKLSQYPAVPVMTAITDPTGHYDVIGLDAPETYVVEFRYPLGGPVVASQQVFLRPGQSGVANMTL